MNLHSALISPLNHCTRLNIPERIFKIVWQRQDGKCARCPQDLNLVPFIKNHNPPLGLRPSDADANDPQRIELLCIPCDDEQTYGNGSPRSGDRKQIDHARRTAEKEAEHRSQMAAKYPGRKRVKRGTIRSQGFQRGNR